MVYGPDRLLYIGLGDGGGSYDQHGRRGNAQRLRTLLGKILRIEPRPSHRRPYSIPATNPFVHRRAARPEIYAYGLCEPLAL
ncbi:MAG: PQQ-dependent sugar dehydrogenase [Actinomycetota bacterium]|nr:PQQ-dependent sugar dehydrogenase [Actinomycetota bacterium]